MCEENSNFHQLLKLRSQENPEIIEWLQKRDEKYTSPEIQNEMLEAMAFSMMRKISANIQNATFFTIMADETADVSNKEQLVICIRWVDHCFVIHEDFIGMHPLERTTADQVVAILKNDLLRMNLNIQHALGQCYDGAATMAGEKTGVATQIKTINGKCLYTHCYGHALNLAVADAIKSVQCISDSLDTVREIGKLVKKSPQRNTKLDKIRAETKNESRGVHAFCPTRWTVRGEALAAVINNHAELMELWDWSLTVSKDTEMKARIRGIQSMMTTFNFYFGCTLGEQLLRQTDNLSRALQDSSTSAAQGNRLAQDVVKTLLKDRTDTSFHLFWARILQRKTTEIQTIEDPMLPRKRKAPVRHEVEEQNTHHFPKTHKDHYRRIYFNAIDTVTQCIATRFEQKDFKIYLNIQELLLKSFASEPCDTELAEVVKMYSEDLDSFKLKGQLLLLPQTAESMGFDTSEFDVNDLVTFLQSLDSSRRKLLSEISTLGKLLLVLSATNAVSERSFSALKRVNTYLRSTTGDSRLNHLMMLHVHKDRTDALTLVDVANDFVGEKENRKQLFGKFSANDIPNKFSSTSSKSTQTEN
ncbi:zinc finger MYM-type protein 1-like isoform X1 [Montipora capricornis]|uniref:zinc finger MYM-type protein 1-like isoform X1 n=2 Tax=Montipora capricornis TaxID=246305 RepID=UPI0035F130D0